MDIEEQIKIAEAELKRLNPSCSFCRGVRKMIYPHRETFLINHIAKLKQKLIDRERTC